MSDLAVKKLKAARAEVVRAQVERFRVFYASYFHLEETIPMVEYFFEKIYNLEGREVWLHLAMDTYQRVKGMMKETSRENIEYLIELNNLTEELDTVFAKHLVDSGWDGKRLSREEYDLHYGQMGHYEERMRQLKIVLRNLKVFYELAHRPISAYLIKPARFMASLFGVSALFQSVEEAYNATLPVSLSIFNSFYEEVEKRETEYIRTLLGENRKEA
ncbi:FFLEELY motif protein [Leptospira santarosai]|uniref:FFLEELY motif protein n=1 Tax=Leptospira santarosai TaxID=28183 RepID=UPI00024894E9|nr:hypothetical protein [Leptospira santarosai]EMM75600.1 hypothetical protein LEP1GSC040_3326 [Leptospira santarosai str. 2000030832]MDI7205788.1 hypothetical protein [Leptospira santarosai]MDI7206123.1 hypothetical protein [Leptospira santarosai]